MSAAPTRMMVEDAGRPGSSREALSTTLLELVRAIGEVTADDREVVAAVRHLLESGQVRLTGNFRDSPLF